MSQKQRQSVKTLGAYLAANRITQSEFAARVGVCPSAISLIVRGARNPRLRLAIKIAKLTGLPVDALLQKVAA